MGIDPVLIPAIMSLAFSGIIGIISQIQHSRCSEIKCWGCSCIRRVPEEEETKKNQEVKPINLTEIVSPREIN
tara:strand:- start:4770 stop:4988 length:219 start_codon:yes stop_codon:yes gene_type:complete